MKLVRTVIDHLVRDRALDLAAQMAFWSLLAVFPFAIFILTVLGFLPLSGVHHQVMTMIDQMMPSDAARFIDHTIREVVGRQRGGLLILSLVGGMWSASRAASSAIYALNSAFGVDESRNFWRRKLRAIALTGGAAALGMLATVALLLGPDVVEAITSLLGLGAMRLEYFWRLARWPVAVVSMWVLLAATYDLLPDQRRPFRLFSPGIATAMSAWLIISVGINLFVKYINTYARTYGTLAGAVVLMLWLYLCSLAVIVGGEVDALTIGGRVKERK